MNTITKQCGIIVLSSKVIQSQQQQKNGRGGGGGEPGVAMGVQRPAGRAY
jgi:hypothetical protein